MSRFSSFLALALPLAVTLSSCGEDAPTMNEGDVAKVEAKADPAPSKSTPPAPNAQAGKPEAPAPTALPADANPALTNPSLATATAPATYKVKFETSQGDFVIDVTRAWAPNGADRFYNLVQVGYFDQARFFRNISGFMVQWGMSAYPAATEAWQKSTIDDDPVVQSNKPLFVTFAKTGAPNSRSSQIFINHGDNTNLDAMGFAPFGKLVEGADIVKKLYSGYGEGAPRGRGPSQGNLAKFGSAYLEAEFPKLDFIKKASIL